MKISALAAAFAIAAGLFQPSTASARRNAPHDEDPIIKDRKFYSANAFDGIMLSTALMQRPFDKGTTIATPRFSMLSLGINLHYDFSQGFGIYSGIGIKNIGFIEKIDMPADYTVKHRIYSVGLPLGIKLGNLKERNFLFLGGGADFALNYRVKGFYKRGDKDKLNEWFSDRTPLVHPYVFAGYSFDPGITIKLQYYPRNFLNTDFSLPSFSGLFTPYAGYKVNLILLSLGFDIHYNTLPIETPKRH
ncbi:MAG: hypothetical protein EOP56_07130 [Sphingobacteriales bacterium]|nr:MAG: hypothetical protein EOP56_07130 [Sphingobacteriales bacterium]